MKKLQTSEEGVSPVIGVILMVAITVVLAAVVFVLVSNLDPGTNATPRVAMQTNDSGKNFTVLSAPRGLSWSDFQATGCTTTPTGTVLAGGVIGGCNGKLTLVYLPTNSVAYQYG